MVPDENEKLMDALTKSQVQPEPEEQPTHPTMHGDRYPLNFDFEIKSLDVHEQRLQRPGIFHVVNKIYVPKFNVKCFSPYIYAGENKETYHNYRTFQTANAEDLGRKQSRGKRDRLILGVETSFDDTCSAVVSSCGKVYSNERERFKLGVSGADAPVRAGQHHKEALPIVVERSLEKCETSMSDLEAIAVTIGPGQLIGLKAGIDFAQALGNKYNLPVIPVNHLEAHCLTPRMVLAEKGLIDQIHFPFLSVLVTGGHTEIILSRGVGLHTVMGFTVDIAIGTFLDRVAKHIAPTMANALQDKQAVSDFIFKYNECNPDDQIPLGYFEAMENNTMHHGGMLVEKLARYGNPEKFELPIPKKTDVTANMSFTGLETASLKHIYQMELNGRRLSQYERIRKPLSIEEVCDFCSSTQFAAFFQVQRKVASVLEYLKQKQIPINGVNLVGGVSCNKELRYMINILSQEYNHQMNVCPADLCTDNAAMIAWMGWELKNSMQDVDIRNIRVDGHKSIPLGSYVRDHMVFRGKKQGDLWTSSEIQRVRRKAMGAKELDEER